MFRQIKSQAIQSLMVCLILVCRIYKLFLVKGVYIDILNLRKERLSDQRRKD
jgi:hypothetical protein